MDGPNLVVLDESSIKDSEVALRAVDLKSESFLGLVDSIKIRGIMNPITVRASEVEGKTVYILVDGLHRLTAGREAGLKKIPCNVLNVNEVEALSAQIMANVHKVETKPAEYSKQLIRILSANPLMTQSELAAKLGKSPEWLNQRLNLLKLTPSIQELVDAGKINLSNGFALSKLPVTEQADWVDRAQTETPTEFMPAVAARCKEIKAAKAQGKDPSEATFQPNARLRKVAEIKDELDSNKNMKKLFADEKVNSPEDAYKACLRWIMQVDAVSVSIDKAAYDARLREREEAAERRKVERAEQRAKEAADNAVKVKEAVSAKK